MKEKAKKKEILETSRKDEMGYVTRLFEECLWSPVQLKTIVHIKALWQVEFIRLIINVNK